MPIAEALKTLHEKGLFAVESRLEVGGIIGGRTQDSSNGCHFFQDSFVIFCEKDGYRASVAGPGNGSTDTFCTTIEEAVEVICRHRWPSPQANLAIDSAEYVDRIP